MKNSLEKQQFPSNSRKLQSIARELPLDHAVIETGDNASNLELSFNIVNLQGTILSPIVFPLEDIHPQFKMIYCQSGSALFTENNSNPRFLARGSAIFMQPNKQFQMLLSRGEHSWIVADWNPDSDQIPISTLEETRQFHADSCSLATRELTNRVIKSINVVGQYPNIGLAWLNLLLHERHHSGQPFLLTPPFKDGAGSIEELVEAIRTHPQRNWSLSEAAEIAGYSPFHLSRLFKAITNMGFPEFIDRCRTEIAINLLLTSELPINEVTMQAGFGSPQAFRNAAKEYTGFLPSEFRISHSDPN